MEEIRLGPYATLETFAVMQVGPPNFPAPYIIGYVRMEKDTLIFTLITGCEARDDALELGEEMELVIEKVSEDEQGNNLIGWKFRPTRREVQ
ncbi:Zn-ribbon domain-containing OB-fold protein [Chloroflexota bacterium]